MVKRENIQRINIGQLCVEGYTSTLYRSVVARCFLNDKKVSIDTSTQSVFIASDGDTDAKIRGGIW